MFDKGFFGGLFDFDGDGKLDTFEKTAEKPPLLKYSIIPMLPISK